MFALLHLTRASAVGRVTLTVQNAGPERGPADPTPISKFLDALTDGVEAARVPIVTARVSPGWHRSVPGGPDTRIMPWREATQTLNGSGSNQRGKYKSAYMKRGFDDTQIDTIWHWLTVDDKEYPSAATASGLLQVDSYGCAVNRVPAGATAVPQRSSVLKLQYQTYWEHEADDELNLAWLRHFYTAMYGERGPWPNEQLDGCYVNYCDDDLEDWPYLYFKDNYNRLQRTKQTWDPGNVFNHQQSIRPPS